MTLCSPAAIFSSSNVVTLSPRLLYISSFTLDDFGKLLPMARKAHAASPFSHTEMDIPHMKRMWAHCIAFDDGFAKVIERSGKVVGGMAGAVGMNQWGALAASDIFMLSKGGTDTLIKEFIKWGKGRNADYVHITDLSGNERYQRLIETVGPKRCGVNFAEGI